MQEQTDINSVRVILVQALITLKGFLTDIKRWRYSLNTVVVLVGTGTKFEV